MVNEGVVVALPHEGPGASVNLKKKFLPPFSENNKRRLRS